MSLRIYASEYLVQFFLALKYAPERGCTVGSLYNRSVIECLQMNSYIFCMGRELFIKDTPRKL